MAIASLIPDSETILTYETDKLWKLIEIVKDQETLDKNVYEKVKYGIHCKFPIWYIINEWYRIYPATKNVHIRGYAKIPLELFMLEKDDRDTEMRKILAKMMDDEITEARVK